MKKVMLACLILMGLESALLAQDYFESPYYNEATGQGFKQARDLITAGQDYRAFFVLDQVLDHSRDTKEREQALILKGWLAYRYLRRPEAISAWQQALDLGSGQHLWINLWLSWLYLVGGHVEQAVKVLPQASLIASDQSLYLTLLGRLSVFPLPLKSEEMPYIDFVTYLKGTPSGVYIGNLYGGLTFFDANTSQITMLEPVRPSMISNGVRAMAQGQGEFFLAKRSGIYRVKEGEKSRELPNLPVAGKVAPSVKHMMINKGVEEGGGLVVLFEREGLWQFEPKRGVWSLISDKVRSDSFLLQQGEDILYLDDRGVLTHLRGETEEVVLKDKLFAPVVTSKDEFWLASPSGALWQVSRATDAWRLKEVRPTSGSHWIAFWGGTSGLFNVVSESGQWQRLNRVGELVGERDLPVPMLSGLIHYYAMGGSYVYLNIASEVYALNEDLLFLGN